MDAELFESLHPGKRVEVLISPRDYLTFWSRGTVTEPRVDWHKGKVRIWLDQMPTGWQTSVITLPLSAVSPELVRLLNQPDRLITPLWELGAIFFFSARVLVTNGIDSWEGWVLKPPSDESPNMQVRLKGEGIKEFPYDPLVIERRFPSYLDNRVGTCTRH